MHLRWYCLCWMLCLACGPSEKERRQQVLAFRELQELSTTEFLVSKIIKANDEGEWYKIGERKILMRCEATVKAGIDLSQLRESDIVIRGREVYVTLPPPQLQSINIRPEHLRVAYEEVGVLRSSFTEREREQLAAQAQKQISRSIAEMGLLKAAEENAANILRKFLLNLGYETVSVTYSRNEKNPGIDE